MPYPEQINLPFNYALIKDDFKLHYQTDEAPSKEPGYWAIIQGNSLVLDTSGGAPALPEGELPQWLEPLREPVCVGSWKGKPLRAFSIGGKLELQPPYIADAFNATENVMDFVSMTLGGVAKQVLHWLNQSRHCSRCGAETAAIVGTWGRKCSGCGAEHFPHIHPCAIVLVKRGNQVLLTRKAEWIPGRYSLVAGFVDFGESLEECAIREIREETGIEACNVRYIGSQNWPFPAQLMAGFVADYAGGELKIDYNELDDARWFDVDKLPILPPKRSIARYIIDHYAVAEEAC